MELDRPTGKPNAHGGDALGRMKGQAIATATRVFGPPPPKAPKPPRPADVNFYPKQHRPSAKAEETISAYAARGFHGGEPNADGGYTVERFDVDKGQRKRYYPAANAAEWYHESARLWAIVDDLTRQQAATDLIEEIRRLAQRAYEIAYLWQRGALSGLPEYASWQKEGPAGDAP